MLSVCLRAPRTLTGPNDARYDWRTGAIEERILFMESTKLSVTSVMAAPMWAMYRRLRYWTFALQGRSPLIRPADRISLAQEIRSAKGLILGRNRPILNRRDAEGFGLWDSAIGPVWTPPGVGDDFIRMVPGEILAETYPLHYPCPLPTGAIVIDCGANVGLFSRYALRNGAARVVAMEPSPLTIECFRRNLAAETEAGRVTLVTKGAWSSEGRLRFSTSNAANPGSHHIDKTGSTDVSIEVTTIDQLVTRLGLPRVDYIKMDIEGAEVDALRGAARTIREFRPRLAVATEHTTDQLANTRDVIATVLAADHDYRYKAVEQHAIHTPAGRLLVPFTLLFLAQAGAVRARPSPSSKSRAWRIASQADT